MFRVPLLRASVKILMIAVVFSEYLFEQKCSQKSRKDKGV
jgi:hypothetical protein